jgi:hypothetical protein
MSTQSRSHLYSHLPPAAEIVIKLRASFFLFHLQMSSFFYLKILQAKEQAPFTFLAKFPDFQTTVVLTLDASLLTCFLLD